MAFDALNRLCKWRTFLTGWQLGTRAKGDPEADAVRNHWETQLILRAELTALTGLLIKKGVFTLEEHTAAVEEEAIALEAIYQQTYPGIRATDYGLDMNTAEALATMRRMNFKP